MHDDFCLRINFLYSIITGVDISSKIGCILRYLTGYSLIAIPEHSVAGFITHLHPLYVGYTSILQGCQHILCMISHSLFHLFGSIALPCSRNFLVARVSPGIRIVEVNHQTEAELLSSPSLGDDIILATPATFRIYPDTQTDGIGSLFAEEFHAFCSLAILIIEFHTILLHLCEPTYIGALGETAHIVCLLLFGSGIIIIAATRARDRKQECCSQQYGFSKYILHCYFSY